LGPEFVPGIAAFLIAYHFGMLTPAKPEEFARELSLRVREWTGKWPLVS
jgi:hypothetical protein